LASFLLSPWTAIVIGFDDSPGLKLSVPGRRGLAWR
jgi:hypothetical protein